MALEIDLVCMVFFVILTILGSRFYQLMDEVDWVGWCKGLNLGMGIVVLMIGTFQWKQRPIYAIVGVLFGSISIFSSTVTFAFIK